jgi:hypothetical protein
MINDTVKKLCKMHESQQETLTQNSATIVCNGEEET